MQGVSRREAARQLGIAEGTLSSRLAAARKRLAVRLGRRGLALSAVLVASEQVTTQLVAATVRSALQEVPIGVVTTLTEGVMRTMLLAKLKLVSVVAMLGAILAVSFSGWEPTTKTATAAPAIKDSVVDGIIWTFNPKSGELTGFHPSGEKVARLTIADGEHFRGITPDGKQIAFIGKKGKPDAPACKRVIIPK